MAKELTIMQGKVLSFISTFTIKHGYAPVLKDIADNFGISEVAAFKHVRTLQTKGKITKENYKARSIDITDSRFQSRAETISIPFYDSEPTLEAFLAQSGCGELNLSSFDIPKGNYFAYRVSENTMVNAGILPGDTVVLKYAQSAKKQEIVLASVTEEGSSILLLRRYEPLFGNRVDLKPESNSVGLTQTNSCRIHGVLSLLLRSYVSTTHGARAGVWETKPG